MGTNNIEIGLPVHPVVFGVFLGVFSLYFVYKLAKFIISIWTGA